jgi:hypothetical protein
MISCWRKTTLLAPVGGSNGILFPVSLDMKTEYNLLLLELVAIFSIQTSPSPTISRFDPFEYRLLFLAKGSL